jgi:hypothetical protein
MHEANMSTVAQVCALLVAICNAVAGVVSGVQWWRVQPQRWTWVLIRVGQVTAVIQAAVSGMLALSGFKPSDGLFWLYALLPVAVGFVAEQLRLASAQQVLEQRGLEDAQAVGRLPEEEQRSVVRQILRRELGVMSAAALVTAFLALRALGTV